MNIQVDPTSSNLAPAMLNSKIRPRAVVGYGVKIFHPSPPNYVTRSPGCFGVPRQTTIWNTNQIRHRQRTERHLKINIWEMVTILWLLLLRGMLYCWKSMLGSILEYHSLISIAIKCIVFNVSFLWEEKAICKQVREVVWNRSARCKWTDASAVEGNIENDRFTVACGNFTLSFGRLRQIIALKCVPHVQHDYFSSFNQSDHCYLALLLPLPLSRPCLISLLSWGGCQYTISRIIFMVIQVIYPIKLFQKKEKEQGAFIGVLAWTLGLAGKQIQKQKMKFLASFSETTFDFPVGYSLPISDKQHTHRAL